MVSSDIDVIRLAAESAVAVITYTDELAGLGHDATEIARELLREITPLLGTLCDSDPVIGKIEFAQSPDDVISAAEATLEFCRG